MSASLTPDLSLAEANAEVERLRTLLAAISARVDQFPLLDDESKTRDYDLGRHDLAESVRNIISPPRKPATA